MDNYKKDSLTLKGAIALGNRRDDWGQEFLPS